MNTILKMKKKINYESLAILAVFLIFTTLLIYRHYLLLTWDYAAYIQNAKYWASKGEFYEVIRAPLMPFIILILSIFGWFLAEFLYIIVTSILFCYAIIKFADILKWSRFKLYLLTINIYVYTYAFFGGTELLSLTFLVLFMSNFINKKCSGHYLGLALLSRYTNIIYFPILFLTKDFKKLLKNLGLLLFITMPWLIYNKIKFNNYFYSIADLYANNVLFRANSYSISLISFYKTLNILIPFFIFGLIFVLIKTRRDYDKKYFRVNYILFIYLLLTIYSFWKIPNKEIRYLFPIFLPTLYFSYIGIKILKEKIKININLEIIIFCLILIFSLFLILKDLSINNSQDYKVFNDTVKLIKIKGLDNCTISSNSWTLLSYYGMPSKSYPWEELAKKRIEEGETIILFKNIGEPIYSYQTLSNLNIYYEDKDIIILKSANNCKSKETVIESYLQSRKSTYKDLYNKDIETNSCIILFKNNFIKNSCSLINNFPQYLN